MMATSTNGTKQTNVGMPGASNEAVNNQREIIPTRTEDKPLDEQSPVTSRWQDQTQRMVAVHHTIFPTGHQLEDDELTPKTLR